MSRRSLLLTPSLVFLLGCSYAPDRRPEDPSVELSKLLIEQKVEQGLDLPLNELLSSTASLSDQSEELRAFIRDIYRSVEYRDQFRNILQRYFSESEMRGIVALLKRDSYLLLMDNLDGLNKEDETAIRTIAAQRKADLMQRLGMPG